MPTPLKDLYSKAFYDTFADVLQQVLPVFDRERFIRLIFDPAWQQKELKERMAHTSLILTSFLSDNLEQATQQIEEIINRFNQTPSAEYSLLCMFLNDYIEKQGIEHFEISVKALAFITPFASSEFAVRPFIVKYGDRMMAKMLEWSLHKNEHIRRLASEGSRPRLPWAMALPQFKNDPSPILPILENLKNDPSDYVRRSVANNLNDIAKDNPETVIAIAGQWKGISTETDALIKHACRTLLKQGNAQILDYFGLSDKAEIQLKEFKILSPQVPIGASLSFSFSIQNLSQQSETLRLEYGIYYLRSNGNLSKKVFKISERLIKANEQIDILRSQSFKPITTRAFYVGKQKLSIIINGQEKAIGEFWLMDG